MSADFQAAAAALATQGANAVATPWLAEFSARGIRRFEALGLPTLKTEAWKYTSLRGLFEADLLHRAPASDAVPESLPEALNRLVLVNGKYLAESSHLPTLEGLECTSFEQADAQQRALICRFLGRSADDSEHPFLALNDGMTTTGLLVHVAAGARPNAPLHLFHVDSGVGVSRFGRVLLVLSERSALTVIEHHIGSPASQSESLTSLVTEAQVRDGATLVHGRVQSDLVPAYNIAGVYVDLGAASHYELHQLTLAARLTRNDIRVRMCAPHASCALNGIYLTRDRQHVDNHTTIEHCAGQCTSEEQFNGIVMDRSRAVFRGRIHIHPGAQLSRARLDNHNLLLSSEAEVDTKPELEIYADDVQCAHGATVGELDADARFYLASRGVRRDTAETLLLRGFAKARIDQMPTSLLREQVAAQLFSRLENLGER